MSKFTSFNLSTPQFLLLTLLKKKEPAKYIPGSWGKLVRHNLVSPVIRPQNVVLEITEQGEEAVIEAHETLKDVLTHIGNYSHTLSNGQVIVFPESGDFGACRVLQDMDYFKPGNQLYPTEKLKTVTESPGFKSRVYIL